MWLLSSRGKVFDAVFTFLLWMLRYRSRERFLKKREIECRFLALHVAVREWRGQANTGSRYEQTGRSENNFKKSQNKCRFGGLKVAVEVWEEIL